MVEDIQARRPPLVPSRNLVVNTKVVLFVVQPDHCDPKLDVFDIFPVVGSDDSLAILHSVFHDPKFDDFDLFLVVEHADSLIPRQLLVPLT